MAQRYPIIRLRSGKSHVLRKGHPWLFSGAIANLDQRTLRPGDTVSVVSHDGQSMGIGIVNPRSDIAVRMLTSDAAAVVDTAFWRNRIRQASSLRSKSVPPRTNAFRLINAEGDFMPGLVVDRYDSVLVMSIGTAGMDRFRHDIVQALVDEAQPGSILERSEGKSREREGLPGRTELCYGAQIPSGMDIEENGYAFFVDVFSGQKTGFFLDQRSNRELAKRLSPGMQVLNAFSYTGAFAVYCAAGGALRVVSVEASDASNRIASRNLDANCFAAEIHPVLTADVFGYLRESTEQFGLVILDPPAFAKSQRDVQQAARGYKDINLMAMRRLIPGGFLMTFSCSNFIDVDLFERIVMAAAVDAKTPLQLLETLGPGPDHPTLLAHPEGRYLKGLLLRNLT
ncbi:MAG TPA: class I SAM-dependent rRNA methyltransferase [bacterium]